MITENCLMHSPLFVSCWNILSSLRDSLRLKWFHYIWRFDLPLAQCLMYMSCRRDNGFHWHGSSGMFSRNKPSVSFCMSHQYENQIPNQSTNCKAFLVPKPGAVCSLPLKFPGNSWIMIEFPDRPTWVISWGNETNGLLLSSCLFVTHAGDIVFVLELPTARASVFCGISPQILSGSSTSLD